MVYSKQSVKNPNVLVIISLILGLSAVLIGTYCIINAFNGGTRAPWRILMVNVFCSSIIDAITQEVAQWQEN